MLKHSFSFDKFFKTVSVFFISSIVVLLVSHIFITLCFIKVNFENDVSLNSSFYFQWLVKAQTSNPLFSILQLYKELENFCVTHTFAFKAVKLQIYHFFGFIGSRMVVYRRKCCIFIFFWLCFCCFLLHFVLPWYWKM